MAIIRQFGYETIGNLEYKYVHITDIVMRAHSERWADLKMEFLVKTVDFAITEKGEKIILPGSQREYPLTKKLSEIFVTPNLLEAMYLIESGTEKIIEGVSNDPSEFEYSIGY